MEVSSLWFNTQFVLGRVPHVLKLKSLENKILKPKVEIGFGNEFYEVKTVSHPEELYQVLKLRFDVFFKEFSTQKMFFSWLPYDIDVYDFLCDHLIVKDKASGNVVACYRLLSSLDNTERTDYYSSQEFDLDPLLTLKGHKLELGRACVHKDFRKGTVIGLLWKGLIEYALKSNTKYMFGCSSINRKDFGSLSQVETYLEKNGSFLNDIDIKVKKKYKMNFCIPKGDESAVRPINSLMHMYLMAGAKMGRRMAYDAEMDCLDIFTLVDVEKIPGSFLRRFS